MLHKGASLVDYDQLKACHVPAATATWCPVPHVSVFNEIRSGLENVGLRVTDASHALTSDGSRYFAVLDVTGRDSPEGVGWVVGLRNSHDKTFPVSASAGSRVFVCDNLAFSGTVTFKRKHTVHALGDLPRLAAVMTGRLLDHFGAAAQRVDAYRGADLDDRDAHDLVVRMVLSGAIPNRDVVSVVQNWRKPEHADFEPRTVWSFSNAVTEAHKRIRNPSDLLQRGHAMHALLDEYCGITEKVVSGTVLAA